MLRLVNYFQEGVIKSVNWLYLGNLESLLAVILTFSGTFQESVQFSSIFYYFQVTFDEDGCYNKNDYFNEGDKYQHYLQVSII